MIEVSGLSRYYGNFAALKDVSFSVGKGQVIGLLGPNGAGKTTTMKIMSCFLPQSGGTVCIGGVDTLDNPLAVRQTVGYLPETNPLYPEMTVSEYLDFAAESRGIRGAKARSAIANMVDSCRIGSVFHKSIGHLSKGFRQRVGLAQAMLHDPQVLILDEPTSGLDPNQIIDMLQLIRNLGRHKTVIHSTHILSEAQETCDRVLVLSRGCLVADASPAELSAKSPGHKIELSLRGQVKNAQGTLEKWNLQKQVKINRIDEHTHLTLECSESRNLSPELATFCREQGLDVVGLTYRAPGLETVFADLTRTRGELP